jgi:UDP-N-acetylglucosamine 2-epimerase (non-hydrolysing)
LRYAIVAGTRPEIVKLAPLVQELGTEAEVVYTGQHYDESLAGSFFDTFGMPRPDDVVHIGGRTRGEQIGLGTASLSELWEATPPDAVVVQGDTNTALAGGLAANAVGIPLVHLEAGLRSFDRAMPEEHNRVLIDHLSDLLLAPTAQSAENLRAERISTRIEVVGNTVVEAVQSIMPSPAERHRILGDHGVNANGFILATIHRPENTDDPEVLADILGQLAKLAVDVPVLFSMHPRTRARIDRFDLADLLHGMRVMEPLDYRSFLGMSAEAGLLVSDSGGVQEEVSVYKRPLVVVRRSTERPEVIGTFTRLVSPGEVYEAAQGWLRDLDAHHRHLATLPCPYGPGDAAVLSAKAIGSLAR